MEEKQKPKKKRIFLKVCLALIVVYAAITAIGSHNGSDTSSSPSANSDNVGTSTTTVNNAQTNSADSPTSAATPVSQDTTPSFQKINIKDLIALDSESGGSNKVPFVEYQGTVIQEKTYTDPAYFFKIEDDAGNAALVDLDPKTVTGWDKNIAIGDTVIIRGINGGIGCPDNSGDTPNLCNDFNVTQSELPLTVLMTPSSIAMVGGGKTMEIASASFNPPIITQNPYLLETLNYSSYPSLSVGQYANNEDAYVNVGVEATAGIVSGFLTYSADDPIHYIEVNSINPPFSEIALEVDDDTDYQYIVSKLNKGDLINVFGTGGLADINNEDIATINVQKIEKCQSSDCQETSATVLFSE